MNGRWWSGDVTLNKLSTIPFYDNITFQRKKSAVGKSLFYSARNWIKLLPHNDLVRKKIWDCVLSNVPETGADTCSRDLKDYKQRNKAHWNSFLPTPKLLARTWVGYTGNWTRRGPLLLGDTRIESHGASYDSRRTVDALYLLLSFLVTSPVFTTLLVRFARGRHLRMFPSMWHLAHR